MAAGVMGPRLPEVSRDRDNKGLDMKCHVHCKVLAQHGHPGQLSSFTAMPYGPTGTASVFPSGKGNPGQRMFRSPRLWVLQVPLWALPDLWA